MAVDDARTDEGSVESVDWGATRSEDMAAVPVPDDAEMALIHCMLAGNTSTGEAALVPNPRGELPSPRSLMAASSRTNTIRAQETVPTRFNAWRLQKDTSI